MLVAASMVGFRSGVQTMENIAQRLAATTVAAIATAARTALALAATFVAAATAAAVAATAVTVARTIATMATAPVLLCIGRRQTNRQG